jgi:hypothetical protein
MNRLDRISQDSKVLEELKMLKLCQQETLEEVFLLPSSSKETSKPEISMSSSDAPSLSEN